MFREAGIHEWSLYPDLRSTWHKYDWLAEKRVKRTPKARFAKVGGKVQSAPQVVTDLGLITPNPAAVKDSGPQPSKDAGVDHSQTTPQVVFEKVKMTRKTLTSKLTKLEAKVAELTSVVARLGEELFKRISRVQLPVSEPVPVAVSPVIEVPARSLRKKSTPRQDRRRGDAVMRSLPDPFAGRGQVATHTSPTYPVSDGRHHRQMNERGELKTRRKAYDWGSHLDFPSSDESISD
jgi:hypothetical protein